MICTTWGRGKDKKGVTSFLNKRSGTQFYHDWKPIKSIIDIIHKKFPGGPYKFQEISRSCRHPVYSARLSGIVSVSALLAEHSGSAQHMPTLLTEVWAVVMSSWVEMLAAVISQNISAQTETSRYNVRFRSIWQEWRQLRIYSLKIWNAEWRTTQIDVDSWWTASEWHM